MAAKINWNQESFSLLNEHLSFIFKNKYIKNEKTIIIKKLKISLFSPEISLFIYVKEQYIFKQVKASVT